MAVKVKKDSIKQGSEKVSSESKEKIKAKVKQSKENETKKKAVNEELAKVNEAVSSSSKPTKVKKEKKPKRVPRDPRLSQIRHAFAAKLCLEQKHLENTIVTMTNEAFPEMPGKKFDRKEVDRTRYYLKNDKLLDIKANGKPYHRCVQLEDGSIVPHAKVVSERRVKAKKITDANKDPLFNFAGVNVHEEEKVPE